MWPQLPQPDGSAGAAQGTTSLLCGTWSAWYPPGPLALRELLEETARGTSVVTAR